MTTAPHILTDHFTLSEPGEQIMPTTLLLAPRISDLPTTLQLRVEVNGKFLAASLNSPYASFLADDLQNSIKSFLKIMLFSFDQPATIIQLPNTKWQQVFFCHHNLKLEKRQPLSNNDNKKNLQLAIGVGFLVVGFWWLIQ